MFQRILNVYKSSFSGLSKETWLLSIVILINRCGYMAVPFMSLYVTQSLHRSYFEAGLISTLFGVGAVSGAAIGGKLTDVFGFRPVQIMSSIIGGILFLVFAHVQRFEILCALSVLIAFFYDAFRPANFTAIAAYAASGKETRSYSLNRLATNVGFAFGITLGGIVASYNYQLLFVIDGAVSIAVGLAILWLLPAVKRFRKAAAEKVKEVMVQKPWEDPWFLKFLLLNSVFATCFFLMFRVVPVFFKSLWHMDESLIGLVLGINGVVIALLEMVMISSIENKRSPKYYIVLGVLVVSVSFAILLIPKFIPVVIAIISIVCFTFGEMLSIPFINTFVIKRSNEFNRGQYAAGYTLSWSVAQIIAPVLGFYVADEYGYTALYIGIVIILVLCAYGFNALQYKENEQVGKPK